MQTQIRSGCLWCLVTALALISTPLRANPYQYDDTLIADTLNEGERDKQFGIRVAIDGDLAVAASLPTALQPGRIHTFERANGVWVRRPEQSIDIYGDAPTITLDMKDGYLIVGSNLLIPANGIVGEARIYRRQPSGWTLDLRSGTSGQMLDVAIDGQIAVISQGDQQNGFVFALRRTGGNPLWSSTSLSPIIDQEDNGFGSAVDIEQGAVVVGAPYEDVIGGNNVQRAGAGAAYVFELHEDTWTWVGRATYLAPRSTPMPMKVCGSPRPARTSTLKTRARCIGFRSRNCFETAWSRRTNETRLSNDQAMRAHQVRHESGLLTRGL